MNQNNKANECAYTALSPVSQTIRPIRPTLRTIEVGATVSYPSYRLDSIKDAIYRIGKVEQKKFSYKVNDSIIKVTRVK